VIEEKAEQRLAEYERLAGPLLTPPVPLEKLLHAIYGLTPLWDEIEELSGETVLGGLKPDERLIVLNDKHIGLFEEKPGLERSTLGHEAGHWEFHVDKGTLDHPCLFERHRGLSHRRNSGTGEIEIFAGSDCTAQYLEAVRRRDSSEEERVVNRFAAALNMPRKLILQAQSECNFLQWRELYDLVPVFDVTISALTTRLQQLNLIYIDENRKIHRSREEAMGQIRLF
jgi:hypothetical protein